MLPDTKLIGGQKYRRPKISEAKNIGGQKMHLNKIANSLWLTVADVSYHRPVAGDSAGSGINDSDIIRSEKTVRCNMSDYVNSPTFFNLDDELVRSQIAKCPDLVSLQNISYKMSTLTEGRVHERKLVHECCLWRELCRCQNGYHKTGQ
uniref:Uncharacterized protein n=1 Tax=Romanomermis culicivorax TaxID=13658 RepID=A0A915K856_ROMCU